MTDEALGMTDEALGMTDEALGMTDEALGMTDEALGMTDEPDQRSLTRRMFAAFIPATRRQLTAENS
jgi:hypothetical protein